MLARVTILDARKWADTLSGFPLLYYIRHVDGEPLVYH
jgi:hypothetical protein